MKATFTTKDRFEINRISKSLDMASFIFDIVYNSDFNAEKLLSKHNIIIDDLIEY